MDIEIQSLCAADIPQAMDLKNALGWNQTPEDWRRFLQLSPLGSFKAMRGGQMVGTAVAHVFDRVCWIGMVIVREGCRQQGVGRLMMKRCLEFSAEQGCSLVVLNATREAVGLYGSLGFRPEFLIGTARGTIANGGQFAPGQPTRGEFTPGADSPATKTYQIRRIEGGDLDAIVSLDAEAQGAEREALLMRLVEQYPGSGFVCLGPDCRLEGFALHRPGVHSIQIGPLIARGHIQAESLLRAVCSDLLASGGATGITLTVSLNNTGMRHMLNRWGLSAEPRLTRMSRGWKRLQAREEMIYAFSGPEKG